MNSPACDSPSTLPQDWPKAPVSVVILTYNEAVNLPSALDSCAWCDDVHVLDSGSTDGTVEIAEQRGVPVHHHAFESFGSQRNWAIDHIPTKHDWVFHLDADEWFTPRLVQEIADRIAGAPAVDGYQVPHKLMLAGRWLKRSGGYPVYQVRLFHTARLRFTDHGHGQREAEGTRTEKLAEPYLHHAYTKGLDDWIAKHHRYSTQEAEQVLAGEALSFSASDLFSADGVRRRRALKALGYRLPGRPTLRWFWSLFVQRGFLDGGPGWTYAAMLRLYEQMIALKVKSARSGVFPREGSKQP